MECSDGKLILFKNLIRRGTGGPIFCDAEKDKQKDKEEVKQTESKYDGTENDIHLKAKQLLNEGLDIVTVWDAINTNKTATVKELYDNICNADKYEPSLFDQIMYNQKDDDYYDVFGCLNDEVIGVSAGDNGVLLNDELLQWIDVHTK